MSTRLNAETVEAQIREMWDGLSYSPGTVEDAINLNTAMEQAREVEAKLRERLAYQEWLDAAAPALLEACQLALQAIEAEKALQASRGESVVYSIGMAESVLRNAISKIKSKS